MALDPVGQYSHGVGRGGSKEPVVAREPSLNVSFRLPLCEAVTDRSMTTRVAGWSRC